MSSNKIVCRKCHKVLATKQHGGLIRFSFNAARSYVPNSDRGPCFWLECSCGEMRSYEIGPHPRAVGEAA